jgi:hypothetical protein
MSIAQAESTGYEMTTPHRTVARQGESRYFQSHGFACRRESARRDPDDVAGAIARSEQRFRAAGGFEAEELARQDRDTRR